MIRVRRLVRPAAVVLAAVPAVAVGLLAALLIHGRLPEPGATWPVLLGTAAAVVVGIVSVAPARAVVRAAVPSLRRAPDDVIRRIADATALHMTTEELLLRSAEAIRAGFATPRVELWVARDVVPTGMDGAGPERPAGTPVLVRTVALGGGPVVELGPDDVRAAARAGVAGEGWARRWLPGLLPAVDDRTADPRRVPLRVAALTESGRLYGLLVVGRRPGSPRFDIVEDEALGGVARLLAAVLRNRALTLALEASLTDLRHSNAELQASRTRVVTAADAERRRIERDLHDGAQQHLLGLAVTVGLVRQMVAEADPAEDVLGVLDQLGVGVRDAIGELRSLAQGIYPALLIDSGLEPALRVAAARSTSTVRMSAVTMRRYPPEVEAAVYFCCLEALQNAAKHAPGADVQLSLVDDGELVRVTVADAGPGFDPAAVLDGTGRASMADRIGAHGGRVRWDSAPGSGTTVRIELPTPAAVS